MSKSICLNRPFGFLRNIFYVLNVKKKKICPKCLKKKNYVLNVKKKNEEIVVVVCREDGG